MQKPLTICAERTCFIQREKELLHLSLESLILIKSLACFPCSVSELMYSWSDLKVPECMC